MTVNTELFRKVYDQISQQPDTHSQAFFQFSESCGTSRCIAGWAIALHHGVNDIYDVVAPSGGETAQQAAHLLGLAEDQASELFYEMDDKKAMAMCLEYATKGDEA